ncbi:MAG: glucose-1-phosphate adenylyltransferase [Pirellulales bacterium]|nr:glucose-1-phosphate adenylyltransferase [Pirellulales bacterium]
MSFRRNTLALVLGGGRGTRLYPLTKVRSKPAVPVAGKYRLIDIPLSNCINSGVQRVYVLTQFNSVSLHGHIRRTYNFDPFSGGFVELLAAQQTLERMDWYQGTADAVRQNLRYIQQPDVEYVLILSGDQLYRMDFKEMFRTHRDAKADVTIAGLPVDRDAAKSLGVMRLDDSGRVQGFLEKPQTDEEINLVRMEPEWFDRRGVQSHGRECLASMGIYLFNAETLIRVLEKTDYQDFGKEIFPAAIRTHRVNVHLFDGYWEDIGTISSFYQANLDMAGDDPPFDFSPEDAPIYSRPRFLPPSRLSGAKVSRSLIADGCVIGEGVVIENSVIGLRCRIGRDVVIRNSIIMGSDYHHTEDQVASTLSTGGVPLGIGEKSIIEGAIVDKNCCIGSNSVIVNERKVPEQAESGHVSICDKVVVVEKNAVLPSGYRLSGL